LPSGLTIANLRHCRRRRCSGRTPRGAAPSPRRAAEPGPCQRTAAPPGSRARPLPADRYP